MACWQFWAYVKPSGRNVVKDWRKDLVAQQRADMTTYLLAWRNQKEWNALDFKPLGGGMFEFKFFSCKKQLRLVGFFWPPKKPTSAIGNFTIVMGCSHKDKRYDPADALETAARRMKDLQNGIGSQSEYT